VTTVAKPAVDQPLVLERTIQVDGIPTRYLTAGTGAPLVLVHGAGDNAHDWSYVLPLLGRSHQVLAPDLPATARPARRRPTMLQPAWSGSWTPSDWTARPWPATPWAGWPPCSWRCRTPSGSPPRAWWTAPAWAERSTRPWWSSASRDRGAGDRRRPASPRSRPAGGCPSGAAVPASMAGAPIPAGRAVPGRSPTRIPGGDAGALARRGRTLRPAAGAG
jgi:hypothetical protein